MNEMPEAVYLGDAVYASYDGFQIWLHLNSHTSAPIIALEPMVMKRLLAYVCRIQPEEQYQNVFAHI